MKTTSLFMLTALMAAGLSACGGIDSSAAPAVTQVPESAAASSQAFAEYVRDLPSSETQEPLSLDLVATAPTSEADDQIILN